MHARAHHAISWGVNATTDPAILDAYLSDASNMHGHAEMLFRPRHTEEVAEIIAWCQQQGLPLTVTARRSSTTGAPVPLGGALLSTELLNTVHAPDRVESGVILGEYQDQIEAQGLFFPPDPTSRYECSLGGAIACNASGARTYHYGPTRPWIEAITLVTPTGQILNVDRHTPSPWPIPPWTEPAVKTAAGYYPADNLLDLIIGAEGTLGVVTEARLKLIPLPAAVFTFFAYFPDEHSLLSFLNAARALGGRYPDGGPAVSEAPRCIEYFDQRSLALIQDRLPEVPKAHAALMIEVEHQGDAPMEFWFELLSTHGALIDETLVADDLAGRQKLQKLRHALPASVNEIISRNGVQKVGTDFSVPDAALPAMLAAYDQVQMRAVCFGHIGNNHLHLNLLPKDQAELALARQIYMDLARQAVALGGSVSAEHGIGKLKKAHLALMTPEPLRAAWRQMRAAADPAGIFGRGTLVEG